jgi:ATP-dependent DNA helicase PIF1
MNTDADDKTIPDQIRRRQFPVRPAFAMTINKSQGQTFQNIAIYLPAPVVAHGQLYLVLSRIGDPRKITILISTLTSSGASTRLLPSTTVHQNL